MKEFIPRLLSPIIEDAMKHYPIVTLTGPRQSGKSTLLRKIYPAFKYVNLENLDLREFAVNDPRGFISTYPDKIIIDEAQKAPSLFSYLQSYVDEKGKEGMFCLAGSHNFLLMKAVSQSLAGRTAILNLLPFSRKELNNAGLLPDTIDQQIYKGFYPRLYDIDLPPSRYYGDYVRTYVERDVRDLIKIVELNKFIKFLRLCAARIGQLLNMTSLATETGISVPTAEGWLSVLEASFIVYRLEPNHDNFNKRVIKSPKLYFYDTGLACYLLGLKNTEEISISYLKGALFENLVINQFIKDFINRGEEPDLTFRRDSSGKEIDLIVKDGLKTQYYEIKSGSTFNSSFFTNLDKWGEIAGIPVEQRNVIYAGLDSFQTSHGNLIPFMKMF